MFSNIKMSAIQSCQNRMDGYKDRTHQVMPSRTYEGGGHRRGKTIKRLHDNHAIPRKSLRMTVRRADDDASPPGLLAWHVYRALWRRRTLRILRQQVPLILVMTYSDELSMFISSLYHEIVGDGIPVT